MQNWPWASCSSDGCSMELLMPVKAYDFIGGQVW